MRGSGGERGGATRLGEGCRRQMQVRDHRVGTGWARCGFWKGPYMRLEKEEPGLRIGREKEETSGATSNSTSAQATGGRQIKQEASPGSRPITKKPKSIPITASNRLTPVVEALLRLERADAYNRGLL